MEDKWRSEINKSKLTQQEMREMQVVSKENIVVKFLDDLPLSYKVILCMTIGYSFISACIYVLTH